jgi:hypothetical protein
VLVEVLVPELVEPHVFEDESDSEDDESSEDDELAKVDEFPVPMPLVSPPLPRPTRRTYLVRGVSTRGRESAPSARAEVPITDPSPPPPPPPTITYTETEILVEWTPAIGARRPIQEPVGLAVGSDARESEDELGDVNVVENETDDRLPSTPVVAAPTPSAYLVYTVDSGRSRDVAALPTPLNTPAVGLWSYRDQAMGFGTERCYIVRVRDVFDTLEIQGPASPPTCVVPADTFPPGPPTGLVAVASEGAISLVWDASPERDMAGYLVLRRGHIVSRRGRDSG